ncbi:MAG: twin-arginine translocase subunit TatC [Chthoniobacterales bacterium]
MSFFDFREVDDTPKPFLSHLDDLRGVLLRMVCALGLGMVLCFVFRAEIAAFIQRPLVAVDPDSAANLQSLGVADSMTISFQLAFYAGLVVSFPALLFFLAGYILPALTPKEKRMLYPAAGVGFGLFLLGISFAYFVVLPQTLEFFFKDAQEMNWKPTWTVREYYSFTTQFIIAFGLAFELPVVVLMLVKLGILDVATLKKTRSFALVIIFFFAAVITPTQDMITLFLMGAPMYLLYESCILIASWMERVEAKRLRRLKENSGD